MGLAASARADTWYSAPDPIDPTYLTEMPFGTSSQWIQPWRAYLDTPPAIELRGGMGINFNVPEDQADVAARLLAASGIARARVEIPWSAMSYRDPTQLAHPSYFSSIIGALRTSGIRPLILLNANQQAPGPTQAFNAVLTASASAGATTVQLDAVTASQVIPGYSGLDVATQAAGVIFTAVSGNDVATLSRPLPTAMAAGSHPATTLRNQPFDGPELAGGSANPRFQQTLQGWLEYVRGVMQLATQAYGSANFDVEVWNELSFGSDFLNIGNYYDPLPDASQGDVDSALLAATVAFLRDPSNGWPDVQIGDGFANETPFASGATVAPGVTALDKHPYEGEDVWTAGTQGEGGIVPLNALGLPDAAPSGPGPGAAFEPTYTSFFPEYFLTGLQTETMIRDLDPSTTQIYGTPHGQAVAPAGGVAPELWLSEMGMDPAALADTQAPLSAADDAHIQAKAALRTYVAYIGKGASAVDLYAVDGGPDFNLVDPAFFANSQVPGTDTYAYSGDALGGPVMDATRRLAATLATAQPITQPRPLSLLGVATDSDAYQWLGNGTAATPTLYDRDVLMFQPFQLTGTSWVAAVYVMTRNIATVYNRSLPATDVTRTDLPAEEYEVAVGGVDAASLVASATDPLTGDSVPVNIIARDGDTATLKLPVSDSPRMITLSDGAARFPGTVTSTIATSAPSSLPAAAAPATAAAGSGKDGRTQVRSAEMSLIMRGGSPYLRLECPSRCRLTWSTGVARPRARPLLGVVHAHVFTREHVTYVRVAQAGWARARIETHFVLATVTMSGRDQPMKRRFVIRRVTRHGSRKDAPRLGVLAP